MESNTSPGECGNPNQTIKFLPVLYFKGCHKFFWGAICPMASRHIDHEGDNDDSGAVALWLAWTDISSLNCGRFTGMKQVDHYSQPF
jgi:hypothetical protein